MGTPRILVEAIMNGLGNSEYEFGVVRSIKHHVIDFLAQRFTAALFNTTSKEEEDRLVALFENITGRKIK